MTLSVDKVDLDFLKEEAKNRVNKSLEFKEMMKTDNYICLESSEIVENLGIFSSVFKSATMGIFISKKEFIFARIDLSWTHKRVGKNSDTLCFFKWDEENNKWID